MLIRTDKEFKKENLPLDFLQRVTSIICMHKIPLRFKEEDFELQEKWKGVKQDCSITPWSDEYLDKGYTKVRSGIKIINKTGFDSDVIIFESGTALGYYKESLNNLSGYDAIDYINLLLEYKFVKYEQV